MHNLLRCRRGTAAFVTVIALVPLIGVVALGGEAGSWYVTKQHAQNAADAAAYSGGLVLACQNAGQCPDTQSVAYRGKEFAAQNAFCNAGDTTYPGSQCATSLPTGTSQAVQINQLTSWNGASGNFVQAIVSQQQPAYLAKVLGLSTVNIGAQAVAQVNSLREAPMRLGVDRLFQFPRQRKHQRARLRHRLEQYGEQCAKLHRRRDKSRHSSGVAVGCRRLLGGRTVLWKRINLSSAGHQSLLCSRWRPHHVVRSEPQPPRHLRSFNYRLLQTRSGPVAYTAATPCTNNNITTKGNAAVTLPAGVYFISGTLTLKGGSSITGHRSDLHSAARGDN